MREQSLKVGSLKQQIHHGLFPGAGPDDGLVEGKGKVTGRESGEGDRDIAEGTERVSAGVKLSCAAREALSTSFLRMDQPQQLLGSVGPTRALPAHPCFPWSCPAACCPALGRQSPAGEESGCAGRGQAGLELLSGAFWRDQCKSAGWSLLSPHPQQMPHPLQYDTDAVKPIGKALQE